MINYLQCTCGKPKQNNKKKHLAVKLTKENENKGKINCIVFENERISEMDLVREKRKQIIFANI